MCKVDSFVITNAPSLRYTAPLQVLRPQDAGELGGLRKSVVSGFSADTPLLYNKEVEPQRFHLF